MSISQYRKKRFGHYFKWLISLLLIYYVFQKVSWGTLFITLKKTDLLFLLLSFAIAPLLILISASKWRILLQAQGIKESLFTLFNLYLVGYFFNNILPTNIGGDVIRSYELGIRHRRKSDSFAAVTVERFTGFTALIILTLISSLMNMDLFKRLELIIPIAIIVIGYGGIFVLIINQTIFHFLSRKNHWEVIRNIFYKLEKFRKAIINFNDRKSNLAWAMVLSFLFYLGAVVNVYIGCLVFGVNVPLISLSIGVPIILLLSMLPISVGGIGLSEWAYYFVFSQIGIGGPLGLAVALLLRGKNVIIGLFGGLYYIILNKNKAVANLC